MSLVLLMFIVCSIIMYICFRGPQGRLVIPNESPVTTYLLISRLSDYFPYLLECKVSRFMGKPTMWFSNRSDINQPVQSQKMAI